MAFRKLKNEDRHSLVNLKLDEQHNNCFICNQNINSRLDIELAYINPKLTGDDLFNNTNCCVVHSICLKEVEHKNLFIANKLKTISQLQVTNNNHNISIKEILEYYKGSSKIFKFSIVDNVVKYILDDVELETELFIDELSQEKYIIIDCPIEYLYQDKEINPRSLNNGIKNLIEEFYKGNPQLHISISRFDNGQLKVLDGQHKAVAQILLGQRSILTRVFLDPNIERLTETNFRAGSSLRQVAFDKGTLLNLHSSLLKEKIKIYRRRNKLSSDNWDFSENDLILEFKGDGSNIKKFIQDDLYDRILKDPSNLLSKYIQTGTNKDKPITNAVYLYVIKHFIPSVVSKEKYSLGLRELQIEQVIRVLNSFYEHFFKGLKYNKSNKDSDMDDDSLLLYRISCTPFLSVIFNNYILEIIYNGLVLEYENINREEKNLFIYKFSENLFIDIDNFFLNLRKKEFLLNREDSVFGTQNSYYSTYKILFRTGKLESGYEILDSKLDINKMIQGEDNE